MTEPTYAHVVGMYAAGIVVGVLLTLTWQTYAAQMRAQAWDNISKAYDKVAADD